MAPAWGKQITGGSHAEQAHRTGNRLVFQLTGAPGVRDVHCTAAVALHCCLCALYMYSTLLVMWPGCTVVCTVLCTLHCALLWCAVCCELDVHHYTTHGPVVWLNTALCTALCTA